MPAPDWKTTSRPRAQDRRSGSSPAVTAPVPLPRSKPGADFGFLRLAISLACFIFSGGLGACSPSHFDGQVFRQGDVAFRLEHLPPTWRRIEITDTALAFRDDENAATVAINGRCGKDAEDVPLASLTQHLFLQFTERQLTHQEVFPLDGREALRTEMVAKLDGVQKYFHVVVLKKDGCVYDFLQIANQHQDRDVFLDFVRGFSKQA
jgi:hypothetical protein